MSLQDWGALGELIGGVAIIVSLIYVGLQVRQGTKATYAATSQSFSAQYSGIMLKLAEAEVREVYWKGLAGLKNLQGSENVAFMALMASIFRMYETFYFEQVAGRFKSNMFDSWMTQLVDLFGNDGVREYCDMRKHNFSIEFVSFVEEIAAESTAKSMYQDGSRDAS